MERTITEDERDRVQGVSRMRAVSDRIKHLLSIPVIRGHHSPATDILDCLDQAPHASIQCFNSPYGSGEIPRMSHHISIRKIEDNSLSLPRMQPRHSRLSDLIGTHLRLQIIGRYFGTRDQETVFPSKRRFYTTVEKIRH